MVTIKTTVYLKLISEEIQEECGVILGSHECFESFYKAKNRAKIEGQFKIGMLDKIKIAWKMLKENLPRIIVFHVHTNTPHPSEMDIKNTPAGQYMIILFHHKIYLYLVVIEDGIKKAKQVQYTTDTLSDCGSGRVILAF
jgi:proteasome lid subunit RPN8/RPN11